MKRRDFIKVIGAAPIVAALPTLAIGDGVALSSIAHPEVASAGAIIQADGVAALWPGIYSWWYESYAFFEYDEDEEKYNAR